MFILCRTLRYNRPVTHRLLPATAFLVILIALGASDALIMEKGTLASKAFETASSIPTAPSSTETFPPVVIIPQGSSSSSPLALPPVDMNTSSSSAPIGDIPPGGVQKQSEQDVEALIAKSGFTMEKKEERSLIAGVTQPGDTMHSVVLMKDGDRAAFLGWLESPRVKEEFLVLKESLNGLFSPAVQDLLDEMQRPEGKPPRNFLTFLDPGLSEERFVLIRVRERLIEVHVAKGKEEAVYSLLEALSQ